jgi:hypothetical protein
MSCGWSNSDELRLVDSAFDPTNLPDGIECSDDPLLAFRSAVYHASHAARTSETKPISNLLVEPPPLSEAR